MPAAAEPRPLVELERVSQRFGPTRALHDVSFDLLPGEVHVLAGENGAGKTTLIRVLSGAHPDYTGSVRIGGRPVRLHRPADAVRAGIATIHQELSLVGSLSVADNLALGAAAPPWAWMPRQRWREAARATLARVDLDLDPDRLVEDLPLAQRQLIEIARALARQARILILDEPTSALSEPEAELLFERIERVRAQGTGLIYISHRMEEIFRVATRITVLRDGQVVTTARATELDQQRLVTAMVGRELVAASRTESRARPEPLLVVDELSYTSPRARRPSLDRVSCSLQRGEILGLFGLLGSGTSELLQALFGALGPLPGARVRVAGQAHSIVSPRRSLASGVALLTHDRDQSVLGPLSVVHNVTLSRLERFSRYGWIASVREEATVRRTVGRLRLNAPSLRAEASQLSGGNQQKVALARCLVARPRLLLLDEPTRGIDVGAKADVYALVRELAGEGVGILLVASELEELVALCDRVLVMVGGRVAVELARETFSRSDLLRHAMGRKDTAA